MADRAADAVEDNVDRVAIHGRGNLIGPGATSVVDHDVGAERTCKLELVVAAGCRDDERSGVLGELHQQ